MDDSTKNKSLWLPLAIIACILLMMGAAYLAISKKANERLEQAYADLQAMGLPMTVAEIEPAPIPDEENAALAYAAIAAKLNEETVDGKPFLVHAGDLTAEVISAEADSDTVGTVARLVHSTPVQQALSGFTTASKLPGFRLNLNYHDVLRLGETHAYEFHQLATIVAASAILAAPKDPDLAWQRLVAVLRMADHGRDEPVLISQVTRLLRAQIAIEGLFQVASIARPTVAQVATVDAILQSLDELDSFALCLNGERLMVGEQYFDLFASGTAALGHTVGAKPKLLFVVMRGLPTFKIDHATYLEIMLERHRIATTPFAPSDLTVADHLISDLPSYCIVTAMVAPTLGEGKVKHIETQAYVRVARIGLALLRHHEETGSYPESLDALGEVGRLVDPFTGNPMPYRRDDDGSVTVYSIGRNLRDDAAADTRDIFGISSSVPIVWQEATGLGRDGGADPTGIDGFVKNQTPSRNLPPTALEYLCRGTISP